MSSSRTIIVSNRLPVTLTKGGESSIEMVRSSGGLVSGLSQVHATSESLWLGYLGLTSKDDNFSQYTNELIKKRFHAVSVPEQEYDRYYNGACNSSIWPLFHYAPHFMTTREGDWEAYTKVNHLFAESILSLIKPGDYVWIHDYHLMLLPEILKTEAPDLEIGFFLHIPFPAYEVFRIHPKRQQILQGLLGADLLGMHTMDYARNFLSSITRLIESKVEKDTVFFQDRKTKVIALPLGVDPQFASSTFSDQTPDELHSKLEGKEVLLGIDRLDYTKGLPERLAAFRLLLKNHPEYLGKIVFLQVCVPSRMEVPNYADLRSEVERLVGQINGEFGYPGYVPLQYLFQPFPPDQVVKFYKYAHIAIVTPLRDGLNLVCKEFVASRQSNDGVLILSELAGAAAEMGEAILVNPYDIIGLSEAMHGALSMPLQERSHRMGRLRERVKQSTNVLWAEKFRSSLHETALSKAKERSTLLIGLTLAQLIEEMMDYRMKVLFLDYDGTLVPIKATPELARPTRETIELIRQLSNTKQFEVAIITGRSRDFCMEHFGHLPVTLAAEHSAFIRLRGDRHFVPTFNNTEIEFFKDLSRQYLEEFTSRVPGSYIEEKSTSLVVHYRLSEPSFAHGQAMDLRDNLAHILGNTPFGIYFAKKALEVKPRSVHKGLAVERCLASWLDDNEPFLTAGDDSTDEDMFRVRSHLNQSIYVGSPTTTAKYHLGSPAILSYFLEKLGRTARIEGRWLRNRGNPSRHSTSS